MKRFFHIVLASCVLATVFACASTSKPAAPPPPAPVDPSDPALMQKMMELATPGPAHEELMKGAGTWEETYKMRMAPDAPWTEFTGSSHSQPVLGGRYLLMNTSFDMMGMPMQGMQLLGYDNLTQEYTSLWADSMSTWWITSRGKKAADGTIDMKGTMVDVAGTRPFRMVIHHRSEDLMEIEMFDTIPPKGEVQVMSITSKRKK